ncbi:sodium:calcium antiporter [Actinoplanes sp. KI2]|uniref:sodium:calcium antiporter n=1 Tax=Actinoplanes sp. KI2 TaxID=2983315 RepID=UPI0021D5CE8F|nr:sodium:calcium antiporter [Actinoplanes sp. KI2]MCU7731015.1 sodium:calcium antiporter [Actinoplanes sp. KI2]
MVSLVLLAAAGLLVLAVAADHLVLGASRVARRLRLSPVVVGVVVIGLGTSAPEFLVSGLAAARGDAGLAVGNLVGSNVVNVTLILGTAALMAPVVVHATVVRREAPLAVGAVTWFALAVWRGLDPVLGVLLGLAGVAALVLLVRQARRESGPEMPAEVDEFLRDGRRHPLGWEATRTVAGLAGTLAGAELLVTKAAALADRLGAPQVIVGFTLVAIGTSVPELVTAIQAQRRGESDLLVGNLLGSNLFNALFGGAVVGLAGGAGGAGVRWPILGLMVLVAMLAWAVLVRGGRVTRPEAALLLAVYVTTLPALV